MKIGLLTIFQVPNYGSVLQAFATQKVLEKIGHECVIINYNYRNDEFYRKHGLKRNRFKQWLLDNIPWIKSGKLYRFRNEHLNLSRHFETYDSLLTYNWNEFDVLMVGSDQVWNTRFLKADPAYMLKFAPSSIPRISLSSSFALKEISEEYLYEFSTELSKFMALSVRESGGVKIINECLHIKKDVKVTLDPTLLLSKEEWLKVIPHSEKCKVKKPYILIYMLTYAFEPRPYILHVIDYYKRKLNAEVIVIEGHRELTGLDSAFVDANNSSIEEFIALFDNADLVITSSFHGTAFALNFGIPLISLVPDNDADDRQTSLLQEVGAQNSITQINTELASTNPYYNSIIVNNNLTKLREGTMSWVRNNLRLS